MTDVNALTSKTILGIPIQFQNKVDKYVLLSKSDHVPQMQLNGAAATNQFFVKIENSWTD